MFTIYGNKGKISYLAFSLVLRRRSCKTYVGRLALGFWGKVQASLKLRMFLGVYDSFYMELWGVFKLLFSRNHLLIPCE
jgi:hypothetical protein